MSSKVPAQASRAVKGGEGRLKSLRTVAGMEECSKWDVAVGPTASCTTAHPHTSNKHTKTSQRSRPKP
jgi:hypothetical protein